MFKENNLTGGNNHTEIEELEQPLAENFIDTQLVDVVDALNTHADYQRKKMVEILADTEKITAAMATANETQLIGLQKLLQTLEEKHEAALNAIDEIEAKINLLLQKKAA